jgi:hypothetical protein
MLDVWWGLLALKLESETLGVGSHARIRHVSRFEVHFDRFTCFRDLLEV